MLGKQSKSSKEHTVFLTPGSFLKLSGLVSFIGVSDKNVGEVLPTEERIQWQLSPVSVMDHKDGNLGLPAGLCTHLSWEVVYQATSYFSQEPACVLQSRQLDWCLLHGWSELLLSSSPCLALSAALANVCLRQKGSSESCQFLGLPEAIKFSISEHWESL